VINPFASLKYARDETGLKIPPTINGNPYRGELKGAMVPVGLIRSIFHHTSKSMAYRLAISTENPLPCGRPHLYCSKQQIYW
jgi:hypothetical protein